MLIEQVREGSVTPEAAKEAGGTPSELSAVLSTLKDRLTDVSKKNRSLRLLRLNMRLHFDLHNLVEDSEGETPGILEKIRKRKTVRLVKVFSSNEKHLNLSYKLNHLQREADFIEKESGNYDLFIGYPFVEGNFRDGTYFRCPIALFPIVLEKDYKKMEFVARADEDRRPLLNRAFLIAYQKFNGVNFEQEIDEEIPTEGNPVQNAIAKYKELGVSFDNERILEEERLAKFRQMRDEKAPTDMVGRVHLLRHAIMGQFPQTSSTLLSDYDAMRSNPPREGVLHDFFNGKPAPEPPRIEETDEPPVMVTDVDSSQERVILASRKLPGLTVHGPPGTGKSQVIVNLIADHIVAGKTVLVVCEKRAALDVVYNRLKGIGLADLGVVVHDYEKDRNAVFDKTARVIHDFLAFEQYPEATEKAGSKAEELLSQISDYHQALHQTLPCGVSLHQLYSNDPAPQAPSMQLQGLENSFDYGGMKELRRKLEDVMPLALSGYSLPLGSKTRFSNLTTEDWRNLEESLESLSKLQGQLSAITKGNAWKRLPSQKGIHYPDTEKLVTELKKYAGASPLRFASRTFWNTRNWLEELLQKCHENNEYGKSQAKRFLTGNGKAGSKAVESIQALVRYNELMKSFEEHAKNVQNVFGPDSAGQLLNKASIGESGSDLAGMRKLIGKKEDLRRLDAWKDELTDSEKKALDIVRPLVQEPKDIRKALDQLEHAFCFQWITAGEADVPLVCKMDSGTYERRRKEARDRLEERKLVNRRRVKRAWLEGMAKAKYSELKLMKYEAEKQSHRWPMRRFANEFWDRGLLNVFPCWLASPETVSALFPLQQGLFDLVVFDEASQCTLEDAIPSVHRAKSVVVAGDEKQLPPFDLFEAYLDDIDDEDAERPEAITEAKENESFLQLAKKRYAELMLKWHYRSKHEELIAFSNHAFYHGRIAHVPASQRDRKSPVIEWVQVNGTWDARRNRIEAEKVVQLIEKLISTKRPPSIGVITFNAEQKELIENLLDRKARDDRSFYMNYRREKERMLDEEVQGLFVKNIENVQGDERDVIIFSIGYAPTKEGGKVITQFGSLSAAGGENRLNVAVSRAREKTYLVSSIAPQDLKTEEAANKGPRLLRKYLEYAKLVSMGADRDSRKLLKNLGETRDTGETVDVFSDGVRPIPQQIMHALKAEGIHVMEGVGAAPYALDLAIARAPNTPDYLLGIECDGRTYRNTQDAKEWDVYRHRFLEKRGWNVFRVPSRQWWEDPDTVIRDIKREVRRLDK
ncbi:hypothetical protein KJ765_02205 [Candidatus Micrarchaeota archaeon]|nr:hypothetical protein [Candidatus Micrarchaeota archaeon]